jgi:hypothetical protein
MSRHRRNAVVTPTYLPPTLNGLLDEEDRDASRATLQGRKVRDDHRAFGGRHAYDEDSEEDDDDDEATVNAELDEVYPKKDSLWYDERYGPAPRVMPPAEMLHEAGLGMYASSSGGSFDTDDDEQEAIARDNVHKLGMVRRGANRLATRVTNAATLTSAGLIAPTEDARRQLLQSGVVLVGPGSGIVVNAAMMGTIPASFSPPTLDQLLSQEQDDGLGRLTVNAAPRRDGFGMVEGCIAGLIAEGEARRGPYRYIG